MLLACWVTHNELKHASLKAIGQHFGTPRTVNVLECACSHMQKSFVSTRSLDLNYPHL